jgi:hypothetical protein
MALGHHLHGITRWSKRRYANECMTWSFVAVALYALGGVSGAAAKGAAPLEPYGTNAEIQRCVADMEASLHGRSILGSRDTAVYIQDLSYLEGVLGLREYDVMVDRCRTRFFHRYNRFYGRQPQ